MLTYQTIMSAAVAVCLLWGVASAPAGMRARTADALLLGLVAGVLLGRALHVALYWVYFAAHPDEITRLLTGGLDWRGATLGAVGGVLLGARLRGVDGRALLERLAPCVPLLAAAGWLGCAQALCAAGAELVSLVGLPAWLAAEGLDLYGAEAPRWQTQTVGAAAAGLWGALLLLAAWRGSARGRLFGIGLAGVALLMFALGFLRGDYNPVLAGLRADQWLDAWLFGVGVVYALRQHVV